MATDFNPLECGLHKGDEEQGDFLYIKDNKVLLKIWHVNYFQGLPIEWSLDKVVHCVDGTTKSHTVFEGRIPTNEFFLQLFDNLII